MSLKFEKLEDYLEQHMKIAKAQSELNRRAESALEEVQALKAEYEALIRRSVAEGVDVTKELDEMDEKIAKAQTNYERRKQEADTYSRMGKELKISKDDVVNSWNTEFLPEYRAKKFEGVLDRLMRAKAEYITAAKAYFDCVKEINHLKDDVSSALGDEYRYKLRSIEITRSDEKGKYLVTYPVANQIYNGDFTGSEIENFLNRGEGK